MEVSERLRGEAMRLRGAGVRFFMIVVATLLFGILLVIALPRAIEKFDRWSTGAVPASEAEANIRDYLTGLEGRIQDAVQATEGLVTRWNEHAGLAWQDITPDWAVGSIADLRSSPDGRLALLGPFDGTTEVRFLSAREEKRSAVVEVARPLESIGYFESLEAGPAGALAVLGYLDRPGVEQPVLAIARRGENWRYQELPFADSSALDVVFGGEGSFLLYDRFSARPGFLRGDAIGGELTECCAALPTELRIRGSAAVRDSGAFLILGDREDRAEAYRVDPSDAVERVLSVRGQILAVLESLDGGALVLTRDRASRWQAWRPGPDGSDWSATPIEIPQPLVRMSLRAGTIADEKRLLLCLDSMGANPVLATVVLGTNSWSFGGFPAVRCPRALVGAGRETFGVVEGRLWKRSSMGLVEMGGSGPPEAREALEAIQAAPRAGSRLPAELVSVLRGADEQLGILVDLQKREKLDKENLATLRASLRAADTWASVGLLVTRITALGLLLYLVQILVNVYRYNLQLAAFYDGCADALDVARRSREPLPELVSTFLPRVGFGRLPPNLLERIVDLAKESAKIGSKSNG